MGHPRRRRAGRTRPGSSSLFDRNLRVSRRARSVLRRQWELRAASPAEPAPIPGRNATIEIFTDDPWNVPLPKNDSEILEQALAFRDNTGRDVLLAAGDYGMMDRASAVGLKAALIPRPENEDADPT